MINKIFFSILFIRTVNTANASLPVYEEEREYESENQELEVNTEDSDASNS